MSRLISSLDIPIIASFMSRGEAFGTGPTWEGGAKHTNQDMGMERRQ